MFLKSDLNFFSFRNFDILPRAYIKHYIKHQFDHHSCVRKYLGIVIKWTIKALINIKLNYILRGDVELTWAKSLKTS